MTPKIKNILIFLGIGIVLILVYSFFFKSSPDQASLTSTSGVTATPATGGASIPNSQIAQDFLTLLLNVKGITLDDSVFQDPAFSTLKDSSIELTPDGTEGRVNPFAPIGVDVTPLSTTSTTPTTNPNTTTVNGAPLLGSTPATKPATPATGTKGTTTPKSTTPAKTTTN